VGHVCGLDHLGCDHHQVDVVILVETTGEMVSINDSQHQCQASSDTVEVIPFSCRCHCDWQGGYHDPHQECQEQWQLVKNDNLARFKLPFDAAPNDVVLNKTII